MCRVFWRQLTPWILVRLNSGGMVSIPWGWTNLPMPRTDSPSASGEFSSVLLSAPALRDLLGFVRESKRGKAGNDKTF
jgi:hypothetical protein